MKNTMLGPYTLISRIGRGGMGSVWKARQRALGGVSGLVAVKLIHADRVDAKEGRARMLKEAQVCMLLRSSNIVTVFDVGEAPDGTCYIVMEWVEGLDLATLCKCMWEKGESFSESEIAYLIGEVLKGLMHAHELASEGRKFSVIHRDVSPQNIIISTRGEVKLLDFGVARVSCEETTSPLMAKGKIRYMPPEQLRGNTRHPTLDIFPVGAILHELLDRRKFRVDAVDDAQLFGFSIAGIVPSLSANALPSSLLEQMREDMLSFEHRRRPQSARDAFEQIIAWPGYRNATIELEAAVRRHLAPKQATSVESSTFVRAAAAGTELGNQSSPSSGYLDSAELELVEDDGGQPRAADPSSELTLAAHERKPGSRPPARRDHEGSTRRWPLVLVVSTVALAAILLVSIGGLGGKLPSPPGSVATHEVAPMGAQEAGRTAPSADHLAGAEVGAAEAEDELTGAPSNRPAPELDTNEHPAAPDEASGENSTATDRVHTPGKGSATAAHAQVPATKSEPSSAAKTSPRTRVADEPSSAAKTTQRTRVPDESPIDPVEPATTAEVVVAIGEGINWGEVNIDGVTFKIQRFGGSKTDRHRLRVGATKSIAFRTRAGEKMREHAGVDIPSDGKRFVLGSNGLQ